MFSTYKLLDPKCQATSPLVDLAIWNRSLTNLIDGKSTGFPCVFVAENHGFL